MKSLQTRVLASLITLLFIVAATASFAPVVDAQRGGGFRMGGSGFRSSSSWSSGPSRSVWGSRSGGGIYTKPSSVKPSDAYGKPSLQPGASSPYSKPSLGAGAPGTYSKPSAVAGKQSSDSYTKPKGGTPGSATSSTFKGGSQFDRKMVQQVKQEKAKASLDSYRTETGKFQKAAGSTPWESYKSSPVYQKVHNYGGFDYGAHYDRRDSFYRGMGWRAPGFAYGMAPSYGIWDTLFWFMILDHFRDRNYAAMAYNHSNDPGYQAWRKDADNLAKDNSELKGKLDALDKQVATMKGTQVDPNYLPKGVPPEVAVAANAIADKSAEKPIIRFATGPKNGNYLYFGELLKKKADKVDIQLRTTAGSMENLRLISSGDIDMAIVQSDVLAMLGTKFPGRKLISEQSTLYEEVVQLIVNANSGIKSIEDIDPRKTAVYIGPEGSGTSMTWEGLRQQQGRYRKIPVKFAGYDASEKDVERSPKLAMLFVGGLHSDILKQAEETSERTGKLKLAAVDDRSLVSKKDENGNNIYQFVNIPSNAYPALQKGWFWGHDVKTLAIQAVLVLRTDWAKKYGQEALDALSLGVMDAKVDMRKRLEGR
ncbi:MAG: TAXI family TRAP transporter solute-binding subunit [Desulfomonilaceae bacterium]